MGRYSDTLGKRLRTGGTGMKNPKVIARKFATGRINVQGLVEQFKKPDPPPRQIFPIVVPEHPQKYPLHSKEGMPDKGAVFGGECNRTACGRIGATWYNQGTRGYYCADDAHGINWQRGAPPLCIEVDHDLTHEEQDELYRKHATEYTEWDRKRRESLRKPLI